jgi:hypothetical protein
LILPGLLPVDVYAAEIEALIPGIVRDMGEAFFEESQE